MPSVALPVAGSSGDEYTLNPSKILCLGLNYSDHIKESLSVRVRGFTPDAPKEPVLFPKTPNSLCGPDSAIEIPAIVKQYDFEEPRTDHEAELAVIIGTRMRNVSAANAMDHVYGYTCANDVSQRNIQNGDRSGWYRGKSFDTFCPVGPCVVPAASIEDPHNLSIVCRVEGRTRQRGNTSQMIFRMPEILEFLSANMTLEPGDLILTGTPAGVSPLSPGDTVEIEIEGIGILKNHVVEGP